MSYINKKILLITLLISTSIWVTNANSEVKMLDENTSKQQIRDAFFNKQPSDPIENTEDFNNRGYKMRSLEGFSSEKKSLNEIAKAELQKPVKKHYEAGIASAIRFKFNSTDLLSGSRLFIKKVGDVLAETDVKFIIEGHTDASGSEIYNLVLSEKRANKIKQIFIAEHNIASERILTEGKGEAFLRFSPNDAKNRRVEIKPLK